MKITFEQSEANGSQSLYWRNSCGEFFMKSPVTQFHGAYFFTNLRSGKTVHLFPESRRLMGFVRLNDGDKITIEIEGEKK